MKTFVRLSLGLIFLLLIGASILLWPTWPAEEKSIENSEVQSLLQPFSWIRPDFAEGKNFSLRGNAPFQTLLPNENARFDFKAIDFIEAQKTASFREAQLAYFSRMKLDPELNRYVFEAPHPLQWGALPYPPIRDTAQLGPEKPPASDGWALNPDYQRELDRMTGHELTKNDSLEIFQNGNVVAPILKIVGNSKKYVVVNVLSLVCDASTEPVIHALEERAQAGVDVRVLLNKGYAALSKPCLQRMRDHQIQIATAPTHSSYYLNDQDEVILGAESMARMFFRSDGYNFLDRDLMLFVKGPVATDVLKNFITVWDKARSDDQRDVKELVATYLEKRTSELTEKRRARDYSGDWLDSGSKHLCRFAEQTPNGENQSMEHLLVSLASKAKRNIFLSGVKFDADSPLFKTALARAHEGVDFDFLGNGWEGGDGELTLYLDELIRAHPRLAPFLRSFRNWDVDRVARKRAQAGQPLAGLPHVQLWSFFTFLHYKLALFDHEGVWVGSANPDRDSVSGYDESGIFCLDKTIAQQLLDTTEIDLANSIPVSTFRR